MQYSYFIKQILLAKFIPGERSRMAYQVDDAFDPVSAQLICTQAPLDDAERVGVHPYREDTVFVGYVSELSKDVRFLPHHCVCIEDVPLPEYKNPRCNLLVLKIEPTDRNLLLLLNHIVFIISDDMRFYHSAQRIRNALDAGMTLREMVQFASSVLLNPVLLIDAEHRVLAEGTAEYPFQYPPLVADIRTGQITADTHAQMEALDLYPILHRDYENHIDTVYTNRFDKFCLVSIRSEGLMIAELIVQASHTPFLPSIVRLMDMLSSAFSEVIHHQVAPENQRALMHNLLFSELLHPAAGQEEVLRRRIADLGWIECAGMCLLVCTGEQSDFDIRCGRLVAQLPGCRWIIRGEQLLLLVYPSEANLENLLEQVGFVAGISWPFESLLMMQYALTQAEIAYARGAGTLRDYGKHFPAHIVTFPAEERFPHLHPAILKLAEYDKSHDGSLLPTLEAWLSGPDQPAEVAARLFIHRSTLFYRLARIRELCGLELTNGEEKMNLLLSIRLLGQS